MSKINNKYSRKLFFSVSIVEFEQVDVGKLFF